MIFKSVYTEEQVKAIENYHIARLKSERDQKDRAQALVKELTQKLNLKNNEIEKLNSLNELLLLVLEASARAIVESQALKSKEVKK